MEEPLESPPAPRDAAHSLDNLRHELYQRWREDVAREWRIISALHFIVGLLIVIALLLVYIGWRLT
jgi:fatty acid desaturase